MPAEYINLFENRQFSPKQAELIENYRSAKDARARGEEHPHIFAVIWGRRCGKSDGCSALFAEMLGDLMDRLADEIAAGKRRPWRGLGKKRMVQRKSKPHAKCLITAPSARDLTEISSFLLEIFRGQAEIYLHQDQSMQVDGNGSRMWFVKDGAAVSLELIPSVSKSAMVGRGWSIVLMSEAGFIESSQWDRLSPALWDEAPWVICEGTPTQDASHWLTQIAVSGLPDGHEEADRTIAPRNPSILTSRANTVDHAFLPAARKRAALEEKYRGKRWADLWIRAKWTAPADVVYDAWREDHSVATVIQHPLQLRHPLYGDIFLPPPSNREIYVDWHGGHSPGAALTIFIWKRGNPLDSKDPRPLFLVMDEYQDDPERLQYTDDGWWRVIKTMREKWAATKIYGDPSGETLMKAARRSGLIIKPAANDEKMARIQLANSLMNLPEEGRVSLIVSAECPKTISVIGTYHWKKDKQTNLPTDKPSQYNDHLSDCLAYCAGHHAKGAVSAPGMGW